MKNAEEVQRQLQHCGYMDRADWLDPPELPDTIDGSGVPVRELGICPGWLVRLPTVIDAFKARMAMDKGELSTFYPNADNAFLENAMDAERAVNHWRDEQRRKAPTR